MKAKFQKTSAGNIDFSEWSLETMDDMRTKIIDAINEILEGACEDGAELSLPFIWGPECDGEDGPAVTDPLTLQIGLPIGLSEGDSPQWRASITDLFEREISGMNDFCGPEQGLKILAAWRKSLAAIIEKIDVAAKAMVGE